jgi:hypothetical protein
MCGRRAENFLGNQHGALNKEGAGGNCQTDLPGRLLFQALPLTTLQSDLCILPSYSSAFPGLFPALSKGSV